MAGQKVSFNRDVRPLLSDRCFQCHGPNEHDRQAELRLDRSDGPDGAYRKHNELPAIQPGSAAGSAVWQRITSEDEDMVMPPSDASKQPLSGEEKDTIRRWIEQGGVYEDFWAFVAPRTPFLPDIEDERWNRQPIDRLVMRRLQDDGLTPKPRADQRTLIRRLSLDLTGLPPSRDDIRRFLADTEPDAWERTVERMMRRQEYGEHMTKYWLDLVRFADTNGIHHDHYREMTPYRDWVIRSLNDNLPYNQFVAWQVAGDLYPNATRDQLIASGFNRLHLIIDRGTALPEESFTRNVVDRVTAVGTAFLGLTVQCAVCHDHKYDPVTMKNFYQLFAFFNNLDAAPETGSGSGTDFKRGLQPPYVRLSTKAQEIQLAEFDRKITDVKVHIEQIAKRSSDEQPPHKTHQELEQTLKDIRAEKQKLEATVPVAMVMKERPDPRPAHILVRGQYDKPGQQVGRNTPGFLPPMQPEGKLATRRDLAEWFISPEHPLTARVAVNRFWQQLFGVGIVKTAEDFGAQGDWPSHPELLDYLAVSFMKSGWDIKALMKQIVLSETYCQTSKATATEFKADPDNRLLARGSRYRLDSEVIRDQILATSGLLNRELFGKSVKPPQPAGLWKSISLPSSYPQIYKADTGDNIYRRSVYTFWKRGMPPPQMTIFNAPSREACIARRERTNTPLQALLMMNELEFFKAARHLAHRTISDRSLSPEDHVAVVYETITSQLPNAGESEEFLAMLDQLQAMYKDKPRLAEQLCEGIAPHADISMSELAAWTMLVSTIYNLDITKTRS